MEQSSKLSTNSLAFIGLANEYCNEIENARESDRDDFINSMLRLLPRLYISITDVKIEDDSEDVFVDSYLDEDYYENVRLNMETLLGPDDVYLEVFESDMKYSETPIGASISEGLADIYQDLYNFISCVKDSTEELINSVLNLCKENFETYWGIKLCNILRAIHNLKYNNE